MKWFNGRKEIMKIDNTKRCNEIQEQISILAKEYEILLIKKMEKDVLEFNTKQSENLKSFKLEISKESRDFGLGFYFPDFDDFIYGNTIDNIHLKRTSPGLSSEFYDMEEMQDFDNKEMEEIKELSVPLVKEHKKLWQESEVSVEMISDYYASVHIDNYPQQICNVVITTLSGSQTVLEFPSVEYAELFYDKLVKMWKE